MFYVGTSKTDVTPPVGYLLEGHDARKLPSDGVHDPLMLKVMTISKGCKRLVLVTSDLIDFDKQFLADLRRDVYKKLKIRPSELFLTASHTHTGPFLATSDKKNPLKLIPDCINCLRLKITGGIIAAIHNEEKALLRWGTGCVNIGIINRRLKTKKGVLMMPNPRGPVDTQVTVLSAVRPNGSLIAIVANYTCHPTTLGTTLYKISADYPGVYQRIVEQTYPGVTACFTNGCCGDVRPALIKGKKIKGGSFNDVKRMGKILAREVIKIFKISHTVRGEKLTGILRTIKLPLDKTLMPKSVQQIAGLTVRHGRHTTLGLKLADIRAWKKYWQKRMRKHLPAADFVPCEVQAMKIGNIRLLGLAGEVMVDYGLKIKKGAGNTPLMVCGYTNAPVGYIPTAEALHDGGYEISSFIWRKFAAPYAPDMEDMLVKEALNLLK
jgi:hypothetical protein